MADRCVGSPPVVQRSAQAAGAGSVEVSQLHDPHQWMIGARHLRRVVPGWSMREYAMNSNFGIAAARQIPD
ncbi:hypothetical protein AS9A_3312 [Hoyosella subflava DQS3-9A1]|uniref:Uncharacterized protein n=1 Tax=Hoyosella subflava (strain DSM 45089 / JCM 17490 / NBRC 109087 / DQS3-9A1) TaxID=443218 RepID=F6EP94_HOYSD|nr:hypothetical protein AS9A_3312 [Hoyosella subflava DQS3-9A1]